MNKNKGIIKQLFWQLLPSQIFCVMVASLSTIINGLIIGNTLDSNSIAALGLVGILSTIMGTISNLISGGARITCGKDIGRGEFERIHAAFTASIIMLLAFGGTIVLVYLFLANPLAKLLGATGSIINTTTLYIRANALGLLPLMISPCLMSFLDMNNKSKYSLFCTFILACCNLVFGLINVKIINGGLFGMGIAASLSQIVCLILLIVKFIKDKALPHIELQNMNFNTFKEIIILGLPSALVVLYQFRNILLNRYAGLIAGEDAVTALSILNTCGGVFDAVSVGLGSTTLMLASVMYGEGDRNSLSILFKYSIITSMIIDTLKGMVMFVFARPLGILFGAEGQILEYTKDLLIFYAITMPFNAFPNAALNAYAGVGKTKLANCLYPFTCFIFPIGSMLILKSIIGIYAVWSTYLIAEILITITLTVISIVKNKHFPMCFDDYLLLDKNVGVKKENRIDISINSIDEVTNVAKLVSDFANEKGADKRRSYMLGLCLEEMASNIVLHGFTKGKKNKNYYVDIYLRYENDEFYTRLRDNAPEFNPQRRLEKDKDDPTKNIGIKMVNKLAKEMNYQTTFGMNVLTIKI